MENIVKEIREKYKYKTELHAHTSGASACASLPPETVVRLYATEGYSSVTFTNHFNFGLIKNEKTLHATLEKHLEDYEKGKKEGARIGINVIFATELRFPGDINDFLFYGADPDFYKDLDIKHTRKLEDFVKHYKTSEHLLIQAHPFRDGITLAPIELIDGIEVFNLHSSHNGRVGVAAKYAEENCLLGTCGTDFHHTFNGQLCALCTEEKIVCAADIVSAVKKGMNVWKIGSSTVLM